MMVRQRTRPVVALVLVLAAASAARADSVGQVATSMRISRGTATLLDPQGRPGVVGMGTDTAVMPGDVLSFVMHFTPVPNGAVRGLGGYVTVYIPRNTEVVGARVVDRTDRTVRPHRGGLAADGVGPRGTTGYVAPLVEGSLSQLYADTGVFYSTDARTVRFPDGSGATEDFITIFNGIPLAPQPTGIGPLATILGAGATRYAHNQWDVIQALGFGVSGGAINTRGQGNTPDMYGSAVAGPDSWYPYEASYVGDLGMPLAVASVRASATNGPWHRVQTWGGEIGRRGVMPPVPDPGTATRIGVLAVDAMGRPSGVQLDGDHPLPRFDAAMPTSPYTRAVRFAVGELVVGDEYLVEISVRVLATPLDPVSGNDVICAEVFGGDASAEVLDGTSGGKDNTWRYFLPAPVCVSLPLLFDFDVDHLIALPGDRLTYTIHGKNLATTTQTNVVVRQCYTAGDLTFVSSSAGGVTGTGTGCPTPASQDDVSWTIAMLAPGEEYTYTTAFDVAGGGRTTTSRAIYTSDQLPVPGFSTVAFTDISALTIIDLAMTATPSTIATPPGMVHYRATVANRGTGAANVTGCRGGSPCRVNVTLPTGFAYVAGSTLVNGVAAANPAVAGSTLTFTAGLANIAPGATMTVELDATVPASTPAGAYSADLETWLQDVGAGRTVSDARAGLAEVIVGTVRSDAPVVAAPIFGGARSVRGTTTEAAGATIRVYLRGIEAGRTMSLADGTWAATVPTLFVGERVWATAQAAAELESLPSAEVTVTAVGTIVACADGIDNDGDMLIDFPADPDCTSATDLDEAHQPQCSDGLDNDTDTAIDFGTDDGCSSLLDDSEAGGAACGNGADDDGDGLIDFPADPGCSSATDVSERDIPACADGADNDGDGLVDYPLDTGCTSALDMDETAAPAIDAGSVDGGVDAGAGGDGSVARDGAAGDARPRDLGGVPEPDSGCGCVAAGASDDDAPALTPFGCAWLAAVVAIGRWRRRR